MLPDWLAAALNVVGIPWPNIDEDELRHSAGDVREFARSLTDSVTETSRVVSDTAAQADAAFLKAFVAHWEGRPGEIAVISGACEVLAGALGVIAGAVEIAKDAVIVALGALATALGVEFFLTGGLADLALGGVEVEVAERAIKAALDCLEQQVAAQLINAGIQPLTDQIPATVRKFLAGGAPAASATTALVIDFQQLTTASTRLASHAHRTDTTGETLRRRSSSRNVAKGGSPIGVALKQALEAVLRDLAEQIPRVVAAAQRDMARFLEKAAQDLKKTDLALGADAGALAGAAGRGGRSGCFVAGTTVLTETGHRPIELLSVGDLVLATDPASATQELCRVETTMIHTVFCLVDLTIDGHRVSCSPEHPFWLPDKGWTKAGDLQVDDVVLDARLKEHRIETESTKTGTFVVYNIEVERLHTYHVSPRSILVHNKPWRAPEPDGIPKKRDEKWLKRKGIDPHTVKDELPGPGSWYDLYVDRKGNIFAVRKGREPSTGEYIGNVDDYQ